MMDRKRHFNDAIEKLLNVKDLAQNVNDLMLYTRQTNEVEFCIGLLVLELIISMGMKLEQHISNSEGNMSFVHSHKIFEMCLVMCFLGKGCVKIFGIKSFCVTLKNIQSYSHVYKI